MKECYIDMHCHILPGVDDGAKDLAETKKMLEIAYAEGIRCIIATPHHHPHRGKAPAEKLREKAKLVREAAHEIDERFRVYLGTEVYFGQDVADKLKEGKILSMNRREYVLVEFPPSQTYSYIRQGIQQLQFAGYEVILAHVERYHCIAEDVELAEELYDMIEKAHEMGLYVGVVDLNKDAPAINYADEYFCASIKNYNEVIKIAEIFRPNGIMSGACDTSVVTVAQLCNVLGLPGHSIEAAINSTDKLKMLQAFSENNVNHPKFQVISREEINTAEISVGFPAVSKPVDSSGSRGISFIENEKTVIAALLNSADSSQSGNVLVEEYMEGPEVSVEMLVIDGTPYVLQITDKTTTGAPHFIEIGHCQPSTLDKNIQEEIRAIAKQAVLAVGLVNSVAHVELPVYFK